MSKPKIKVRDWDGDRSRTKGFILECLNCFTSDAATFATDPDKISFAVGKMTEGSAYTWKITFLGKAYKTDPPTYGTWKDFREKIEKDFESAQVTEDAIQKMQLLKQGQRKAEEYTAEFRVLADASEITELPVLSRYYLNGLNSSLRQKLISIPSKLSKITEYYEIADRLDNQFHADRALHPARQQRQGPRIRQVTTSSSSTSTPTDGVPLNKLTPEERIKLRNENKCFRCRKPGHFSRDCPLGNNRPSVRQVTTEPQETTAATISAMMAKLPEGEKKKLTEKLVEEGF